MNTDLKTIYFCADIKQNQDGATEITPLISKTYDVNFKEGELGLHLITDVTATSYSAAYCKLIQKLVENGRIRSGERRRSWSQTKICTYFKPKKCIRCNHINKNIDLSFLFKGQ
jgi:hypothetical protein